MKAGSKIFRDQLQIQSLTHVLGVKDIPLCILKNGLSYCQGDITSSKNYLWTVREALKKTRKVHFNPFWVILDKLFFVTPICLGQIFLLRIIGIFMTFCFILLLIAWYFLSLLPDHPLSLSSFSHFLGNICVFVLLGYAFRGGGEIFFLTKVGEGGQPKVNICFSGSFFKASLTAHAKMTLTQNSEQARFMKNFTQMTF